MELQIFYLDISFQIDDTISFDFSVLPLYHTKQQLVLNKYRHSYGCNIAKTTVICINFNLDWLCLFTCQHSIFSFWTFMSLCHSISIFRPDILFLSKQNKIKPEAFILQYLEFTFLTGTHAGWDPRWNPQHPVSISNSLHKQTKKLWPRDWILISLLSCHCFTFYTVSTVQIFSAGLVPQYPAKQFITLQA